MPRCSSAIARCRCGPRSSSPSAGCTPWPGRPRGCIGAGVGGRRRQGRRREAAGDCRGAAAGCVDERHLGTPGVGRSAAGAVFVDVDDVPGAEDVLLRRVVADVLRVRCVGGVPDRSAGRAEVVRVHAVRARANRGVDVGARRVGPREPHVVLDRRRLRAPSCGGHAAFGDTRDASSSSCAPAHAARPSAPSAPSQNASHVFFTRRRCPSGLRSRSRDPILVDSGSSVPQERPLRRCWAIHGAQNCSG